MNGEEQEQKHWFFTKWPDWLKVVAAIGTIGGSLGTVLGLGGTLVKAVQSHDDTVRGQAIVAEQLKQRNDKIDKVLTYHSQQLWTMEKNQDVMNKKLDKIVTEVKK